MEDVSAVGDFDLAVAFDFVQADRALVSLVLVGFGGSVVDFVHHVGAAFIRIETVEVEDICSQDSGEVVLNVFLVKDEAILLHLCFVVADSSGLIPASSNADDGGNDSDYECYAKRYPKSNGQHIRFLWIGVRE